MKWIKRISILLVLLVSAFLLISWIYVRSIKPDYNETCVLPGLSQDVEVYFDQFAIPHIYADNEEDVYRALGYLHAKERLWQIELLRRISPGRLSEALGDATIQTDRFFRTIGIHRYSVQSADDFRRNGDPKLKSIVTSYIDGVNTFIQEGATPIEYRLLGIEKSPFTLEDIYNIGGYMAFSFAMAHKTEPVLSFINDKYGEKYLSDLNIQVDPSTALIGGQHTKALKDLSLNISKALKNLPSPQLIGSNSWIVGSKKSQSPQPLFANDPHIGFSQPAVWFEAHLEAPGLSIYGNFLAGYPMPQMGHSRRHVIGLTMFENDDIDFFREEVNLENPTEYRYNGKWNKFEIRSEEIDVKGGETIRHEIKESVHGPIVSGEVDGMKQEEAISMWWTYLQFPNRLLDASYKLMNARDMGEAREGASLIHAPGLNVMYADIDGNIAWWASGKLPIRPGHVNSKLILDGRDSTNEATGYLQFDDNPHQENPEIGFVYSANNQPVMKDNNLYPGYYLPEDRARRIVRLLKDSNNWDVDGFKKMLLDVKSENAPEIVGSILENIEQDGLSSLSVTSYKALQSWNGSFDGLQIEPTIYTKLIYKILEKGMKDELGELFDIYNGTHVMKRSIQPLLANKSSVWWDDQSTTRTEGISEIFTEALNETSEELSRQLGDDPSKWYWNEVHTLEHPHALSANGTLRRFLNVGPFNIGGSTEVINNLQFRLSPDGTYETLAGPSCRRIVDLSDISNNSWSILPTGQSGHPTSPHYNDQAEMYALGVFRKTLMDKNEIEESHLYKSTFNPSKEQ